MLDILQEMETKKQQFSNVENELEKSQKEINTLTDELKRLQGEYRLLVRLGQEQGLLDEKGNIIDNEE